MTDLVTRLRAAAATTDDSVNCVFGELLREAAEVMTWLREESDNRAKMIIALKAKLAEAEKRPSWAEWEAMKEHVSQHAQEACLARAECAALRDAIRDFVEVDCDDGAAPGLRAALSQPGPGAALLERVRKLKAVAEKAADVCATAWNSDPELGVYSVQGPAVDQLEAALAALKEKL